MNRDDVLSAAREAGFNVGRNNINGALFSLTRGRARMNVKRALNGSSTP